MAPRDREALGKDGRRGVDTRKNPWKPPRSRASTQSGSFATHLVPFSRGSPLVEDTCSPSIVSTIRRRSRTRNRRVALAGAPTKRDRSEAGWFGLRDASRHAKLSSFGKRRRSVSSNEKDGTFVSHSPCFLVTLARTRDPFRRWENVGHDEVRGCASNRRYSSSFLLRKRRRLVFAHDTTWNKGTRVETCADAHVVFVP